MLHRRLMDIFHLLAILAVFSEQLPWPIEVDGIAYKVAKLGAMVFLMLTLLTHQRFAAQPRNLRALVICAWAASMQLAVKCVASRRLYWIRAIG
jgi:hypothetical protein